MESPANSQATLEQLEQPARLSLGQRLWPQANGIDVAFQQQRFRRLIAGVLGRS